MEPVVVFSPAKINLFLAITGRRSDGFHELLSLAAPVAWGDTLSAAPAKEFTLACDDPAVPLDETNLVLRAARLFNETTGWSGGAAFVLRKRIPMGAGLGGGSSNAVAALKALNLLAGGIVEPAGLMQMAARLGSDCPLFLAAGAVVMRGRGERIEACPATAASRLRGLPVMIFKPEFGIGTAWAYERNAAMAAAGSGGGYLPAVDAERRLEDWVGRAAAPVSELLFNTMEPAVFSKFIALPALLGELRGRFGLAVGMSGSGSACFAILPPGAAAADIAECIRSAWGSAAFVVETHLA